MINLINLALVLIPIWWLIGIKPIVLQLSLLFFFIITISKKGIKPNLSAVILFVFCVSYTISIIINLSDMNLVRGIGTLSNLTIWFCGFIILVIINSYKLKTRSLLKIVKPLIYILIISSFISIIGLFLFYNGTQNFSVISPVYNYFPGFLKSGSEIIKDTLTIQVVRSDYNIIGTTPRSGGLYEYPNAFAIGIISILPLILNKNIIRISLFRNVAFIFAIISLVISGSRSTIIGLFLSLFILFYLQMFIGWRPNIFRSLFLSIGLIVVLYLFIVSVSYMFEILSLFRPGSTRLNVFEQTLSNYISNNKYLFGIGFKPRTDLLNHPIGSHSTFLGVLMKTGLLGFSYFILFIINIISKIVTTIKSFKYYNDVSPVFFHSVCMLTSIIWMVVEDIDAPPLAAFSYFISLGIFMMPEKYLFSFYNSSPKQIKFI